MEKNKKNNEGEMGSGDSDDEFYNVKLPFTPASDKSVKKVEVKKVYSPPRTKVKYDYKFDSSSDEESENASSKKGSSDSKFREESKEKKEPEVMDIKKEDSVKDNSNLPQSTFKVVEKINEELKNMKKTQTEKAENMAGANQNPMPTSMANVVNVPRPQIGVVPPVVVVPPPMVVPQASVMNMSPMIVQPVGMSGQNILPGHMNVMQSQMNMLRGPNPMGGLLANSGAVMGMNAMPGQMPGMMGMQGSLMGLQGGMINPATMGGINMAIPGNMMRVAGAGSNMIRMQTAGNNLIGMQGGAMGIPRPGGNIMGVPRSMSIPAPPGGMMVNPGGLMVMGGIMSGPSIASASQGVNSPPVGSNVRMMNAPQGSGTVRGVPPPFMNIRGKLPVPGSFRWQANPRMQVAKTGSPCKTSSPGIPSPASSPVDKDDDGDEKDKSDKSSTLETDESQSPPRELPNSFKNDGSFMEMFKKMKEESSQEGASGSDNPTKNAEGCGDSPSTLKKPPVMISGIVGKRRGGRVLKTGLVKKVKKESEADEEKNPKDAWSMYMAEVKKYREASCEEEGKTRPLVK